MRGRCACLYALEGALEEGPAKVTAPLLASGCRFEIFDHAEGGVERARGIGIQGTLEVSDF